VSVIEKSVEVDVPVRAAYDQWTQFEDFPRFMEGVEEVEQIDDVRLRWHVNIGGVDREFEARILEQEPDRRIAWSATEGESQAGTVLFEPLDMDRTLVRLEMSYDTETWTERVADFLNLIERRVEGDLERFKSFIEERQGHPTGDWRGEVQGGAPTTGTAGQHGAGSPAEATRSGEAPGDLGTGTPADGPGEATRRA
jgi:uncharacterized membrane protein